MAKLALMVPVLLWAQWALGATEVTQVSSHAGSVVIAASAPPNFTTFTMDNPPRLVVDLAEADFQGVPSDIAVNQSGVQSIKTLHYGAGSSAVARVMITYKAPIQTDILTDGNSIVVRPSDASAVAHGPSSPQPTAIAQAAPPAAATPAPSDSAGAPMDDAIAVLKASPAPAAPPPSPPPAVAEPATPQAATPPAAPAEPVKIAERAPEPPPAPEQTSPPASAPSLPPVAPSGLQLAQNDGLAAPPPAAAVEAPAPAPVATPEAAAAPPPLKINTQAELASPPPPPATEQPAQVSSRRKTLSLVGLRFNNGALSVFVRTNEPVSYHVSERPTGLLVTIENTRIVRRNDTRPLDAHFFDSPVANVRASQNRRDVDVEIQFKNHAAYQAKQTGREVELNFTQG